MLRQKVWFIPTKPSALSDFGRASVHQKTAFFTRFPSPQTAIGRPPALLFVESTTEVIDCVTKLYTISRRL
jgi:hypothetical protein